MQAQSLGDRSLLAEKILSTKQQVAESATQEFFVLHPDLLVSYGERGRRLGIEDAINHQRYLAAAIEAGAITPFADYARWTVSMLSARNIAAYFVIENLNLIGQITSPLLSPGEHALVSSYIDAACQACEDALTGFSPEAGSASKSAASLVLDAYLVAAIRGDRRAAANIALAALDTVTDVVDLYVNLFQAAQYEVGRLWQANKITVADEHMATAITQFVMAQVYSKCEDRIPDRGRVVITGIEGELHQVGANMVADVLDARGWNVRFLGTNLPNDGILQAIEEHRADTVGISATTLLSIPKVVRLVEGVRQRFRSACPRIILGGRAFLSNPSLVEELNAAGPAMDLRSALALF